MLPGDKELTEAVLQRLYKAIGYDPKHSSITPEKIWLALGHDAVHAEKNELEPILRCSIKGSVLTSLKVFGLYSDEFEKYLMPLVMVDLDSRGYHRKFLELVAEENKREHFRPEIVAEVTQDRIDEVLGKLYLSLDHDPKKTQIDIAKVHEYMGLGSMTSDWEINKGLGYFFRESIEESLDRASRLFGHNDKDAAIYTPKMIVLDLEARGYYAAFSRLVAEENKRERQKAIYPGLHVVR